MTPAMKAMAEAMAAEMERQSHKGGTEPRFARLPGLDETHYFSGNLNLEKVARAGLEAIREPDVDLILAGAHMDDSVGIWWPRLVDHILHGWPERKAP